MSERPPAFPRGLNRRHLVLAAPLALWGMAPGRASKSAPRPPRFVREWGRNGKGDGEFDAPIAIAVDRNDRLYVTDFKNLRVQRFNSDGAFEGAFPVPYGQPGGIAVNRDGTRIYVAHWNQNKIAIYSPTGELRGEWGQKGTGDGDFQLPGGIAFARDGSLLVADQGNSRVQRFTPEGKFLSKWGQHGAALGQFGDGRGVGSRFAGPQFLAVDRDGNVYATEVTSSRVQRFSAEGQPVLAFGNGTEGLGGFAGGRKDIFGPIGVCVDREGYVWVSATNHRVQQFDREGHFRQSLGEDGSAPGQFHYPHALVVDSRNHLYVVDAQNDRIQKFAL